MQACFYNARKNESNGLLVEATMFPEVRWIHLRIALAAAVELKNPGPRSYCWGLMEKIEEEKKAYFRDKAAPSQRGSVVFSDGNIIREMEIMVGKPFASAYKSMMAATCNGYVPKPKKYGVKFDAGNWGSWAIKPDGTTTVEIVVKHTYFNSDGSITPHERNGDVVFKMTVHPDGRADLFQTDEMPVYKRFKVFGRLAPVPDHVGDIARIKKAFGV